MPLVLSWFDLIYNNKTLISKLQCMIYTYNVHCCIACYIAVAADSDQFFNAYSTGVAACFFVCFFFQLLQFC